MRCSRSSPFAEQRGSRFTAKAYYSYSDAMEDVDFQGGGLPTVQNSNRLELERGRVSSNRTHSFVCSGVWALDYYTGSQPVIAALANDWTISTIVTVQSGSGLTIAAGQDRNLDGINNDRANLVGDPKLSSDRPQSELIEGWFNTAAFTAPSTYVMGNAPRWIPNNRFGPTNHADIAILKNFRIMEV